MPADGSILGAEVVLPCPDLAPTLAFFCDRLGFRVDAIHPADDPSTAVVSGHGVTLRLERDAIGTPGVLRLRCRLPSALARSEGDLLAPNGTHVVIVDADPPVRVPDAAATFTLARADAPWIEGRAGMRYRDLIPGRQGGRFIASHIKIDAGGPVPDYVHFHRVRLQMIYCRRGWVRVVYEDQGPPFVLEAGDCVLQPPRIRHRVLESSPGLEVIELTCPADHETLADHDLSLPTARVDRTRDFGGQRFVHHRGADAAWQDAGGGLEARDLGIGTATHGLAQARVLRASEGRAGHANRRAAGELCFFAVLRGTADLCSATHGRHALREGDACTLPADDGFAFTALSDDCELLEVSVPTSDRQTTRATT